MKKIIILLAVLAAIIIGAVVSGKKKSNRLGAAIQKREKLLPELADAAVLNNIRKIHIKEGEKEVTLALTGSQWTITERDGFPGAYEKIRTLLLDLSEQKISKVQQLGKSAWGEVKLETPAKDNSTRSGTLVELLDEKGKLVKSFVVGDTIDQNIVGKEKPMFGGGSTERFVRVPDDGDTTVWIVSNAFAELKGAPEEWVNKSFIDVQKVKTVEVTQDSVGNSWKATRSDEAKPEFTLVDAKSGEEFDGGKASLASLLGGATFTDVATKAQAAAPDFMKGATTAKLITFDGFTYDIQVLKKGTGADEKAYLTLKVSGNFEKTRAPAKDEKEEDKKKKDEEFAAALKTKEEKLANEKKFEGWTFQVSSYAIDALLKKRSEVLKDKAAETPAAPTNVSGSPVAQPPSAPTTTTSSDGSVKMSLPAQVKPAPVLPPTGDKPAEKKPITVTTPPVAVPPLPAPAPAPKPEDKPAAPPAAAPAPPPTPAPATPPAEPKKP